jgi:hypothetical protein
MMDQRVGPEVPGDDRPARPIGWWIKEADRLLDAAFEDALAGLTLDRRGWQVLATLARRPCPIARLVADLAPFDPPDAVRRVLADLTGSGAIEESATDAGAPAELRLTEVGEALHAEASGRVGAVRARVTAALPGEDYPILVGLLQRLVAGLTWPAPLA